MNLKTMLNVSLGLFDGGGAAGAGAAAGASGGAEGAPSAQGETNASRGSTRRGKSGEYANVVFGKQSSAPAESAEKGASGNEGGKTMQQPAAAADGKQGGENLRQEFLDLVNGKYKDIYTTETQRIINDRFKKEKANEQRLSAQQPIIDALMQHYGIEDGDLAKLRASFDGDDAMNGVLFSKAAEEAGMSVEQYRKYLQVQQENISLKQQEEARRRQQQADAAYNEWMRQAAELTGTAEAPGKYPSFDLATEAKNPRFLAMLRAGVPMQHAYEVTHLTDILASNAASTARETEKRIVDNVRAKGMRPNENGTTSQPAVTVKSDPSKFTKADRAEIARRVRQGERIVL